MSRFGRGPSFFGGRKVKGIMSLISDLVLLGNIEILKGKFRLDSWLPRSGNTRKVRGLNYKFV